MVGTSTRGPGAWAERAGRRTQRTCYRLAFICTKYREGEEPTPFVVEIDLTRECWAVRDVTDEVNQAGHQAREAATQAQEAQRADVVVKLVAELERRQTAGEPVLLHTAAVEWLRQVHAMTRKAARHLLATEDGRCWRFQPAVGEDEHRRSRSG